MNRRELKPGIEWVGAVDWQRRLFDELIPLPQGTSYNAYLVRGSEKTVLLDAVDPAFRALLLQRLEGVERIDYLVAHHAEQDHSGTIPDVLARFPQAKVLATPKGVQFLQAWSFRGVRLCLVVAGRPHPALPVHALGPLAGNHGFLPGGRPDPVSVRPVRLAPRDLRSFCAE